MIPLPGTSDLSSAHLSAYRLVSISFISSCSVRAFRSVMHLGVCHASPLQPFWEVGSFEGNFGRHRDPHLPVQGSESTGSTRVAGCAS